MYLLTEKINNLKVGPKAEADRQLEALDEETSRLEGQLEQMLGDFNDKHFEVKHLVSMK